MLVGLMQRGRGEYGEKYEKKEKGRKGNDADQNEGIMVRAHRTLSPLSMPEEFETVIN